MHIRLIYISLFSLIFQFGLCQLKTGAEQTQNYLPLLQNKQIALVVNQTSTISQTHLVDSLLQLNIKIKSIFAPEHGFRGDADAGAHVSNGKDKKTGLPIISLYGNNKNPTPEQLKSIDLIIFDIQDVGSRFYTYISTMHYVMEACAEQNIPLLILDRPNPNGMYVDRPVLDMNFQSFVGMHPIPVLHGLTVGELAQMINGEKWLKDKITCNITIIPCENYTHQTKYSLPIKPSPNLPNDQAIALYPSLCFFEGTIVSVGRGTDKPFQLYGHNSWKTNFSFIPKSTLGATNPPLKDQTCYGFDLSEEQHKGFTLDYLIKAYQITPDKSSFISSSSFFNKLVGNGILSEQLKKGLSENEIRKTWETDLNNYKKLKEKYLLYP